MDPRVFDTTELPGPQQIEAWQSWWDGFEIAGPSPSISGFPARAEHWNLGGLVIGRVATPPLTVVRNVRTIHRTPVDHWAIALARGGTTCLGDTADDPTVPAGRPYVLTLGRPLVSHRETADTHLQFYLPRDTFRDLGTTLDNCCGQFIEGGLGSMLADYMHLVERHLPHLQPDEFARLTGAVGAMVGACLQPTADRMAHASGLLGLARLQRVRRAVRANLRSPSLGPATLCRLVGMSRSQLYRLLEPEGGVARWIQRERLLEAHSMLSNPANSQTIAAIAEQLCFTEASSFSRAFRREFAVQARDVRAAALAGLPPLPINPPRLSMRDDGFSAILRGF